MSKLVILESPTKTKTVQKYLGKGYDVVSSTGHVRDLPPARLSVDVKNDFKPTYAVLKGKEKIVKDLQAKAKKAEQVILATDPDREGEAIAWHLAALLNLDLKQMNRVTFNEITKSAVLAAMDHPRKVDIDLVNAQQTRRILDRLVGYRLSPFVSQKIRRGLSAGRVQSVAVRLICDREDEINAFQPEEYWTIAAKLQTKSRHVFTANFAGDKRGKIELHSEEETNQILRRLEGAIWRVAGIKKGQRKKNPAPPFTTSTLQQEASRRLGFQAKRTMRVAQELYEGIDLPELGQTGLITYMRTDSLRISEEARQTASAFIARQYGKEYLPADPRYYKSKANAQDGHEAIRPSMPELTPEQVKASLSSDQFKLYDLIWKRFMACLMSSCNQDTVKATIVAGTPQAIQSGAGLLFNASGFQVRFDGFTRLYVEGKDENAAEEDEEEGTGKLPDLHPEEPLGCREVIPAQHFTQPPPRFTEASLIKALEENGVGRPSTYAPTISTIVERGYVQRAQKNLLPTELGFATTKLLKDRFPDIVNVKFTAEMENNLDAVGSGERDYIEVLHAFYDEFEKTLAQAKADMEGVKIKLQEDQTDIPCEKCGRMMVIKTGKFGRFLACPGFPECKNAKPLIQELPALCPLCNARLVKRRSKAGREFYGCSAYPKCTFATWHQPLEEKCPQCQHTLFLKRAGEKVCEYPNCGYTEKVTKG
ncbi:MAG: type I DNA topoisomerase [Oscillospiraceae bacterium]|jgi:DNA topoisomerase-1|nr:type I DNA topoisomerase [Oscillospiraceae bacterium]